MSSMHGEGIFAKPEHRAAAGFTLIDSLADAGRDDASLGAAVIDEESCFLRATLIMIAS
jgi:hypothetical protein